MVIRDEQLSTFKTSTMTRADARLARYARQRFPDRFGAAPETELVKIASEVRRRADEHGITEEQDVATALDLTVMYGPDFYAEKWASDVFAVQDWTGAHKMQIVRERVRRQVPNF